MQWLSKVLFMLFYLNISAAFFSIMVPKSICFFLKFHELVIDSSEYTYTSAKAM